MSTFTPSVARVLQSRASEIATRWRERASAATPRRFGVAGPVAEDDGVRTVRAVVGCLDRDARWQGEVMRLAWAHGAAAQATGLSVHHLLKDTDLLLAMLLSTAEEAARAGELAAADDGPAVAADTFADALAVGRRLQRATGLYGQAAASSYLHALLSALRARWRLLRHDLRNPLGTIRSAISLMEDETLPEETRNGPRIRAMVARNAGSLEDLIASGLDDRVAESMLSAPQDVSLRDIALAVRRSLREATRLAECEIVVDEALPSAVVDEAAVELTLSTLLLAAVACARPGDVVRVVHAERAPGARARRMGAGSSVVLRVVCEPAEPLRAVPAGPGGRTASDDGAEPGAWNVDGLALAMALATEYGGRIVVVGEAEGRGGGAADRLPSAVTIAAAADSLALELELPLVEGEPESVASGSVSRPTPSVPLQVAPDAARPPGVRWRPAASERHLRDDVPRVD